VRRTKLLIHEATSRCLLGVMFGCPGRFFRDALTTQGLSGIAAGLKAGMAQDIGSGAGFGPSDNGMNS
jgi:hypothetical protein